MKHKTKDEKFMVCVYETAGKSGDVHNPVNRYEIGNMIGLHPKAVDTICKLLLQANFIKKDVLDDVYLTPHGEKLVLSLLQE